MSRRRLVHGKFARKILEVVKENNKVIRIAVRGNVEEWRNQHGIQPKGLRVKG